MDKTYLKKKIEAKVIKNNHPIYAVKNKSHERNLELTFGKEHSR